METSEKRPIAEVELADLKRHLADSIKREMEVERELGKANEKAEERWRMYESALDQIYKRGDQLKDLRAHADALADRLQSAVDRINDMLEGDDGQAWKEAEKALPIFQETLTAYRNREG